MKIAITTSGTSLESPIDRRFGRTDNFLIYDLENDSFEVINNEQNLNLPQGAGIQSAQNVANAGVNAVITGHVGPKAYATLEAAEIAIFFKKDGTVQEAIDDFKNKKLTQAQGPDKEGHWV